MAKKNEKVEPSTVREWAASDEGQKAVAEYNTTDAGKRSPAPLYVGERGRLNPVHRSLFEAAHPGQEYAVGHFKEQSKNRTFKHKALDKRGRNRTATVTMTLAEARALIGDTGKGRLDTAAVIATLEKNAGVTPKDESSVEKS